MTKENGKDINKRPPGSWIDDQPDPLDTVEDVNELFDMVEEKKAKRFTIVDNTDAAVGSAIIITGAKKPSDL
jgi:hypothetical protein